jgi:cell wall-associated NlpC family hydrolase
LKFKFTWGRKLIAGILLAAVVVGGTAAPAEAAGKKSTAVVAQDNYRKTLCKGFLGKSYGSVVDGIRCDCSGYTRAALNRLESKGRKGTALKNVSVGAHCTRDWVSGSSISYTTGVATKGAIQWNSGTKKSIGRKSSGKSLSQLELGDVVVYGKGGSSSHIAIYFGEFSSMEAVKDYLEDIGVYAKGTIKRSAGDKYSYSGRTIVHKYGNSRYWRIHSTCSGIMIDNDIAGTSGYTSSFGQWKWIFDTGIQVQ